MNGALKVTTSVVVLGAALGCSVIAGFDELHGGCPAGLTLGKAGTAVTSTCVASGGTTGKAAGGAGGHAGGKPSAGGDSGGGAGGTAVGGGAGGAGGAGGGESDGGGDDDTAAVCAGTAYKGAAMAPVRRADGSVFLVDRTEVTLGEYAAFVAAHVTTAREPLCPAGDAGATRPAECEAFLGESHADEALPQVCVDWCEADAYCKWAGKELCADTTQSLAPSLLATESDYYAACASGTSRYGCRAGCQQTACNGIDAQNGEVEPVGAMPDCAVGARDCAVSDLSGNVAEWTAACTPDKADGNCAVRGGSYQSSEDELACTSLALIPRRSTSVTVGFRCCVHAFE